jgi:hypothetical protein
MNAVLKLEPRTLTRASLIGLQFRLGKVYGISPLGIYIAVMYDRALGERTILEKMLPKVAHLPPMANAHGKPCSQSYYDRQRLTTSQRERRELKARMERGERFDMFLKAQAS